jgi:ketosteroid isomerase-like protein
MAPENSDALRSMYSDWERGDLRSGRELLDEQIESVWPAEFPSGGTYRGRDGHARAMREWLSPWEDFSITVEGFFQAENRVVVPFLVRARGRGSGVAVERRWAHVWTLRDGKAVRFEVELDPDKALRALGAR